MPKKYRVTLTGEEREELERLLSRGKADVRCLKHAQILLKADEADGGPGWSDERIAEAFHAGVATVERLRQRFVEEGLQAALRPTARGHAPMSASWMGRVAPHRRDRTPPPNGLGGLHPDSSGGALPRGGEADHGPAQHPFAGQPL